MGVLLLDCHRGCKTQYTQLLCQSVARSGFISRALWLKVKWTFVGKGEGLRGDEPVGETSSRVERWLRGGPGAT